RKFTESKAKSYGLTGWVRNASDGTVVGEAQGDAGLLNQFLECLRQGPPNAVVQQLESRQIPFKARPASEMSFEIRH
ncbi:hypothetical protein FISHEDRAFT_34360, partial [Fistulina hepatica ATCC 64428]